MRLKKRAQVAGAVADVPPVMVGRGAGHDGFRPVFDRMRFISPATISSAASQLMRL